MLGNSHGSLDGATIGKPSYDALTVSYDVVDLVERKAIW